MTRTMTALAALLLSVPVVAQVQMMQQRDTRVTPTGPASISGVILTEGDTPQPVRRAEVRALAQGVPPRTTYTDAAGRFTFGNLPLGRYTIEANKPGFVRLSYGARRYDRPGTPVTVSDTQRTQALDMRMARGSVITGRIVDEFGQPAQGARVNVQQVRMVNGERTLTPVPMVQGILGEIADDRGVYRLFGLPAGDYVVSATPRSIGTGDIRRMTDAEIAAARQALAQPTAPLGEVPPPTTLGFSQVFYPGVLSSMDATPISVGAGEERAGVDFTVQLVRTATLEGVVITPGTVRPESVQLMLTPRTGGSLLGGGGNVMMFTAISVRGANNRVNPDGTFSYAGVTPGAYTLNARATAEGGASLWASADVVVDGQTISGLTLALQDGLTVSGRLAFDADGVDVPEDASRARVFMAPAGGGGMTIIQTSRDAAGPSVSADGTFRVPGLTPGPHRVVATFSSPEANWTLKSAIIKGQDALDMPFELLPTDRITDAVITFTNRTQEVTGTLSDASQRPAPDYTIVVFPEDSSLWGSQRRIRTARPGTDGRFTVSGLPSGAYRIAAVTDIAPEEMRDPVILEELRAASIAFALADGETKVQDLRIRVP
jgi:large repetitive protein